MSYVFVLTHDLATLLENTTRCTPWKFISMIWFLLGKWSRRNGLFKIDWKPNNEGKFMKDSNECI